MKAKQFALLSGIIIVLICLSSCGISLGQSELSTGYFEVFSSDSSDSEQKNIETVPIETISETSAYEEPTLEEIIVSTDSVDETISRNGSTSTVSVHTYVLNSNTKKFHEPDCRDVKKIASKNYQEYTGSREEIIQAGYSPCAHCNP